MDNQLMPEERDMALIKRLAVLMEELRDANGVHELMCIDDIKHVVKEFREREVRVAIVGDRVLRAGR